MMHDDDERRLYYAKPLPLSHFECHPEIASRKAFGIHMLITLVD
jgi:hypothetical protein